MPNTEPFETKYEEYDSWFDENEQIYESELLAIQSLLPTNGDRVEIGVGSGRFASRLSIELGVEPAKGIAKLARARGIEVRCGAAESLPLDSDSYDVALSVTTICFVDDVNQALAEARRILKPGGCIVLAFVPKDSHFGELYEANKESNDFYRMATLYTKEEVFAALERARLRIERTVQTLTRPPTEANDRIEEPTPGHDKGSFVVVRAIKEPDA